VPTPYEVFIVRKGGAPAPEYAVLRIDKSDQPSIAWLNPSVAAITCNTARVWHFQNFATIKTSDQKFSTTSVRLDCGHNGY